MDTYSTYCVTSFLIQNNYRPTCLTSDNPVRFWSPSLILIMIWPPVDADGPRTRHYFHFVKSTSHPSLVVTIAKKEEGECISKNAWEKIVQQRVATQNGSAGPYFGLE